MIPLLSNVRVLEIGSVVLGPFAGQILADLGAEVIKVEPREGDLARNAHPQASGVGALYINNNRNKKAIVLDLKSVDGKAIIQRMIERTDVLLHNMRTDAIERLGIGFDAASAFNPRLIYCSANGFGQRGRYRKRPAFDDIIQAASGLAYLSGHGSDEPHFVSTLLADKVGALHAVYGILAALVARAGGRQGAIHVEVPMFETMVSFILNEHLSCATFSEKGQVGYPRVLSSYRRPHRTRDGWIAVLPYTGEQWRRFLLEVGQATICEEAWFIDAAERQTRLDYLYTVVSASLISRDTSEWIETLSRLDIPCSEVNRLEDLLEDPHLTDIGFFNVDADYPPEIKRTLPQPVLFGGVKSLPDCPPPNLGEHTREILQALDFSIQEIDHLLASGAAEDGEPPLGNAV
jgi:crotonobetainyl-CoA:carnitine CoA-transferase CaiB-like acyl-CoA transferase